MDSDSDSDHSSESGENNGEWWLSQLQGIKENDPQIKWLAAGGESLEDMTDEGWEELGRDISNNTHVERVEIFDRVNDHEMSCLCRGLTGSRSIKNMDLSQNGFSAAGIKSMVPFLHNATNLHHLELDENNIESAGFNELFWALRNSPIEMLSLNRCCIKSIEIDSDHIPQSLTTLRFGGNNINSDGCRELSKLMKRENATLETLQLYDNNIADEGVEILVDALKNNTILRNLYLFGNDGISEQGLAMILKLVNDVSSIEATLESNHTLRTIDVENKNEDITAQYIQLLINESLQINKDFQDDLNRVGREKIIQTQLKSKRRKELTDEQGVSSSLYSEIDPLHLPEVLALVGRRHGQRELYVALKSSIAGVISTVNRRECIKQQRAYHATKLKELDAELAAMDEAEREVAAIESHSKRRRK